VDTTAYEKKVLYGITKFPNANDRQIAEHFGIKQSTVAAIRKRLKNENYFRPYAIPMLQNFGAELMAVIYNIFNPVIPLERRIELTEDKIEAAEEIFFSMGEEDKGFSISFSKDYTTLGMINDIRTTTFGSLGLMDKTYPKVILFPFMTSKTYRFFDFAPLLAHLFDLPDDVKTPENFFDLRETVLSHRERSVLCRLVDAPDASSKQIAEELGITRHTVGRLKKKFMNEEYLKTIVVPDFNKLDLKILAFYHVALNPHNPPDYAREELRCLLCDEMIFFVTRRFEFIAISMHTNYETYKVCKTKIIQKLKENDWVSLVPHVRTYSLNKSQIIKDFTFLPITEKTLGC
jgi:DNA-binding MarR family transcriptional regulator